MAKKYQFFFCVQESCKVALRTDTRTVGGSNLPFIITGFVMLSVSLGLGHSRFLVLGLSWRLMPVFDGPVLLLIY
jgi:hypothetical protein